MKSYKIYDAMTINPISVKETDTIMDAAIKMRDNKIASLVVKNGEKFIGLLTEKDIVRKLVAENFNAIKTTVSQIMSRNVKTITSTADIVKTISTMSEINQRQMPVVENGKLLGLLTIKDILRIQPQLFGLVYENYNIKEEDRKPIYQASDNDGICESCGNYTFGLSEVDGELICPECMKITD